MPAVFLFFAVFCLGLGWLLPNDSQPWIKGWNETIAFAGLLLLACSLNWRKSWQVHKGAVALLCVFSLSLVAQCALLYSGLRGVFGADIGLGYAYGLAFFAAIVFGQNLPLINFKKFAAILLFFTVITSVLGMMQWLRVSNGFFIFIAEVGNNRVYGNLNQPNLFASVCAIGICLALYLKGQAWLGKFSTVLLLGIFVLAGVLSGSRTFLLQIVFISLALLALRWRQPKTAVQFPLGLPIFLLLSCGLMVVALPNLNILLLLEAPRDLQAAGSGNHVRLHIYQTFVEAIAHKPWLGYGWQQQRAAHWDVADLLPVGQTITLFESAHNIVLDILVTMGLPLGVAVLLVGCWLLWLAAKHSIAQPKLLPLLLLLGCVLIHAQLEYPLFFSFILIPFGLVLGHLLSEPEVTPSALAEHGRQQSWRIQAAWFALPVLIAAGVFAQFALSYIKLEEAYTTFRFEAANIGSVGYTSTVPDLPSPLVQQELAYLRFAQQKPRPNMRAEELAASYRVAQRYPYNTVLLRYAKIQELNGQSAASADTRRRFCHLYGKVLCAAAQEDWQRSRQEQPALGAW